MKQNLFQFVLHFPIFAFLLTVSPLLSLEKIDLVKICDSSNTCNTRSWEITDSFSEEYLKPELKKENWKPILKFPVAVQSIYPQTQSMDFTMRLEFNITEDYRKEEVISGLYLDAIGDAYSIYLNGRLVGKEGKVENGKVILSRYGNHLKYPLNFSYFKEGKNVLVFHIQGNPKFNLTGLFRANGYYLDEYDKIVIESRDRTGIILIFLYLFFGAYHLFLYLKRRHEKYNLAFSVLSLSAFIYLVGRTGLFFEYGLDSTIGYRIELMSVYFIPLSLGIFLELLFFERIGRYFKGYIVYSAILFCLTPFIPQTQIVYILRAWQISALVSALFLIYVFRVAIKKKSDSAKRLMVGLFIMVGAAIFDVLDSIFFKTGLILTRFGFFSFIVGIVGILANRFLNLHETVENLNKTLEDKVEQRTRELQETLTQVKLLKEQQDGDYFLTTLIINPLASNRASDERLDLKILIHQKKKFEFKSRIHEIGGDICISESIYLKGKKYTAFVNGDAMGKSIQGAGGALVLGVVFKSILSRARLFSTKETVFPERWLKVAFQELQSVFESFDGSMMISVVMGLIDNDKGFLYYINAEHPFCVLYRDNKASFIEKELNLRKIGIMTAEHSGDFQVNTFKLEDSDVIILGSDGRDDIKLGLDEQGGRVINEDENLFLETVESAGADLEKIFAITQKKGELIDDYSLLRIEYKNPYLFVEYTEEEVKAEELYKSGKYLEAEAIIEELVEAGKASKSIYKIRAHIPFQREMYNKAADLMAEYLDLFPEDNSILLQTANSYKLSNRLELAADYAERLKLREPRNLQNLILLAEIYFDLKIFGRAKRVLDNASALDSENQKIKDLRFKLNQI